jgi:hypothetical protein
MMRRMMEWSPVSEKKQTRATNSKILQITASSERAPEN